MFSIRDKHVFLTGGSSGIGLEVARRFHEAGARITVLDLSRSQVLAELGIVQIEASVSDEADLSQAMEQSCERFGPIDILINNAGIAGGEAPGVDPGGDAEPFEGGADPGDDDVVSGGVGDEDVIGHESLLGTEDSIQRNEWA